MDTKHTKGPWYAHATTDMERDEMDVTIDEDGNGMSVAHVFGPIDAGCVKDGCGESWKRMEANARLIAAAPELLEATTHALRDAESRLYLLPIKADGTERAIIEAQIGIYKAAIQKAEGV